MNRSGAGVMQSSPVQQIMMATGNPIWWNTNAPLKPPVLSQQFSSPNSSISSDFLIPSPNNCNFNLFPQNPSSSSSSSNWPTLNYKTHQEPPPQQQHHHLPPADSWSQLLVSGLSSGDHDEKAGGLINHFSHHDETYYNYEKMETVNHSDWEDHHHHHTMMQQVKQENPSNCEVGGGGGGYHFYGSTAAVSNQLEDNFNVTKPRNWPPPPSFPLHHHHHHHRQIMQSASITTGASTTTPASTAAAPSPQSSCVTAFSSASLRDLSSTQNPPPNPAPAPPPSLAADRSSECKNSSAATGGALKKAKVQPSSSPSTFKVRKFGDRITALHQLVSPFGKTDTASVLLEAIGYIRFLQSQIEALSVPYLSNGNGSVNNSRQLHPHPHTVQGDQRNSLFPEDPGQLLNNNCLKRKAARHEQDEPRKDLRSRGLCLVPVPCTALHVGNEIGADYWAPALGGFR